MDVAVQAPLASPVPLLGGLCWEGKKKKKRQKELENLTAKKSRSQLEIRPLMFWGFSSDEKFLCQKDF